MAFIKTNAYHVDKIGRIREAIQGTTEALENLTEKKQIEAHIAQIDSYNKSLLKAIKEYHTFRKESFK